MTFRRMAVLSFVAGLVACSDGVEDRAQSGTDSVADAPGRFEGIKLSATDQNEYPESEEDKSFVLRVESLVDAIDRAIENDSLKVTQRAKLPAGFAPMDSSGAAPKGAIAVIGVVTGPRGDTVAIVEQPVNQYGILESVLVHYFDSTGVTVAVAKRYDYPDNGCAETVVIDLQWILDGERVVQHKRRLIDEDKYDIDPERCVLGAGDSALAHPSRAAYSRALR